MTAFANTRTELDLGAIQMEIRSVNNRYLDLHLRLPEELRFSEASIREILGQSLRRGKVELRVSFQRAFHGSLDRCGDRRFAILRREKLR